MGAVNFELLVRANSLEEAYEKAYNQAEDEEGNDPYSGTIATTHSLTDVTKEYKRSGKSLNDFIEDYIDRKAEKRQCFGITVTEPVRNTNTVKSKVDHYVHKGTRKWVLYYEVWSWDNCIGHKEQKADAVKLAREYTEKHQKSTTISLVRKLVDSNPIVARVEYKSSSKEKPGQFALFGLAAC
jgi:hypothetical protein